MKALLISDAPSQDTLVKCLLLSPVYRLHLSIQPGAPRFDWAKIRREGVLPPKFREWAAHHFLLDFTQFWAYGTIGTCTVTTPTTGCQVAERVFHSIPGREHLTHLQVLPGNRTLSAAVAIPVPVHQGQPDSAAVNFMRRTRFFTLNQDQFPPRVLLDGVEFRVFYHDANDPRRPRRRNMVAEACRHIQNACGILFALRTADQPGYAMAPSGIPRAIASALRWCEDPAPDPRQIRLPEGLAHLFFAPETTDAFPFSAKLATTHALELLRERPCPLPLLELNAIARDTEQDPDDLLPFSLEVEADLVVARGLLGPVWRTHREEIANALRELQARTGMEVAQASTPEASFSAAELHGLVDPEGWTPPRL